MEAEDLIGLGYLSLTQRYISNYALNSLLIRGSGRLNWSQIFIYLSRKDISNHALNSLLIHGSGRLNWSRLIKCLLF